MANNYVIYSDDTFRTKELPDWVAELHGWPLVGVETDEEGNETEVALTWTLYEGFKAHGTRAGVPFPILEDEDGKARRVSEDQASDWAVPYNSVGGKFHSWIWDLCNLRNEDYKAVYQSIKECGDYIQSDTE